MTMPGVQKPHCTAPCATNASRRRSPSGVTATPSIVVRSRPSQSTANIRHALTDAPSTRIVQEPHSPSPQPYLVPVNPSTSRISASAVMSSGTLARRGAPLMVKAISRSGDIVEHSLRQVVDELAPIPFGRAHVGDRPDLVARSVGSGGDRRRVEGATFERRLGARRARRGRSDRTERDAYVRQHAFAPYGAEADRHRADVERR